MAVNTGNTRETDATWIGIAGLADEKSICQVVDDCYQCGDDGRNGHRRYRS